MTKYSVYFGEHSMRIWVACVSCRFRISGFLDSSVGKQSACSADPSSIPGSGRSPGEGIGYPLQYSRASLVTQLVKNWPAMWETWVWFLGWEDPLEMGMATHSSILAWRVPGLYSTCDRRVRHDWVTFTSLAFCNNMDGPGEHCAKWNKSWEFSGGIVVRILGFHCNDPRFNPWLWNWDPASQAVQPNK